MRGFAPLRNLMRESKISSEKLSVDGVVGQSHWHLNLNVRVEQLMIMLCSWRKINKIVGDMINEKLIHNSITPSPLYYGF
jgi:hypothetical protein